MTCDNQTTECDAGATQPWFFSVRMPDETANPVQQSNVTSIRVDLYDDSAGGVPVNSAGAAITDGSAYASPTVSSVIYNAWQTTGGWDLNAEGWNGFYSIAPPLPRKYYRAVLTLSLTGSKVLVVTHKFITR